MSRLAIIGALALLEVSVRSAYGQQPKLPIRALDLDDNPVPRVQLYIGDTIGPDASDPTNATGFTQILLDKSVKPGRSVRLQVNGTTYRILAPWEGRVPVPSDPTAVVEVTLIKEGRSVSVQNGMFIKSVVANINSNLANPKNALKTIAQQYHVSEADLDHAIRLYSSDDVYDRGMIALYRGQYAEAVNQFSQALQKAQKEATASDKLVNAALFLGHAEFLSGDYQKAAGAYRQAASQVTDDPHLLGGLASTLVKIGDLAGAEEESRRVLGILERESPPDPEELANALTSLGYVLQERQKCAEAAGYVLRALEIWEKKLLPGEERLATANHNVGVAKACTGDYQEAGKYFQNELKVWELVYGSTSPSYAEKLDDFAVQMYEAGQYQPAEGAFQQALGIWKDRSPDHRRTVTTLRYLARIRSKLKDYAGAQQFFYRALNELTPEDAGIWQDQVGIYDELYLTYKGQGDNAKMELCYVRIVEILKKQPPSTSRNEELAVATRTLALQVYGEGDYQRAKPLLQEALQQSQIGFPSDSSRANDLRQFLDSIDKMLAAGPVKPPQN